MNLLKWEQADVRGPPSLAQPLCHCGQLSSCGPLTQEVTPTPEPWPNLGANASSRAMLLARPAPCLPAEHQAFRGCPHPVPSSLFLMVQEGEVCLSQGSHPEHLPAPCVG